MVHQQSLLDAWGFTSFVAALQERSLWHEPSFLESPAYDTIRLGQKELVNLAGISFLGFQQDEEILEHFLEATRRYGIVTAGSRLAQGVSQAHQQVEEFYCHLTGKERALSFASGCLANLGFLHAMGTRFGTKKLCGLDNRETVFLLDRDCHWSLRKGVEGFPQHEYFPHNDPIHLEQMLARLQGAKIVVVFESVYSTDGGVAPIGTLLDVCERYGAVSFVDDANGFLIYGPSQRPFAQEFAHLGRATFVMTSFSKSVGLEGGIIAGPADAIRAFEFLSGTSIFTAAIQPPTASTIHFIMHKLVEQPALVDGYLEQVALFRRRLEAIGCRLNPTPTYITSILVGDDEKVEPVRRGLFERGYLVTVFHYPAVRFNHAMIRILPNRMHTSEQIEGFLQALTAVKEDYQF
ncbi:pyridoxal phosphate-dependent aminotransferase family protein [Ktedonosporobacter rubrisoli]|uniref:Pyridoxal phosphate-dependent aminotransferase family protein n=1 Tax=Ktedonosporobacter rubrisoli TaxID=2509675 RepID=A0A4P6JQ85_KTERU|nr:pyridoxal phosphate-dependent aminotransferase family protein [Ktedonosporobacter rubrisoli]QBD77282.1 pyridoxal phosphate-dependent aminotransferase family protein [Ktedonosporobacter rubrisoli]